MDGITKQKRHEILTKIRTRTEDIIVIPDIHIFCFFVCSVCDELNNHNDNCGMIENLPLMTVQKSAEGTWTARKIEFEFLFIGKLCARSSHESHTSTAYMFIRKRKKQKIRTRWLVEQQSANKTQQIKFILITIYQEVPYTNLSYICILFYSSFFFISSTGLNNNNNETKTWWPFWRIIRSVANR